jgi:hypothetical protein
MKNDDLEFVVAKSNKENYLMTLQIIYGYISNNEPIPVITAKYLFSILLEKEKFKFKKFAEKAKLAAKHVVDFVLKYPAYELPLEFKNIKPVNESKDNFQLFAEVLLHAFYQYDEKLDAKRKHSDSVGFFYKALTEETINKSGKKIKITKYKLSVLATVFSKAAEYKGSKLITGKPYEIYQSSRISLSKKPQNI